MPIADFVNLFVFRLSNSHYSNLCKGGERGNGRKWGKMLSIFGVHHPDDECIDTVNVFQNVKQYGSMAGNKVKQCLRKCRYGGDGYVTLSHP
jgi:hypothetical protein